HRRGDHHVGLVARQAAERGPHLPAARRGGGGKRRRPARARYVAARHRRAPRGSAHVGGIAVLIATGGREHLGSARAHRRADRRDRERGGGVGHHGLRLSAARVAAGRRRRGHGRGLGLRVVVGERAGVARAGGG